MVKVYMATSGACCCHSNKSFSSSLFGAPDSMPCIPDCPFINYEPILIFRNLLQALSVVSPASCNLSCDCNPEVPTPLPGTPATLPIAPSSVPLPILPSVMCIPSLQSFPYEPIKRATATLDFNTISRREFEPARDVNGSLDLSVTVVLPP